MLNFNHIHAEIVQSPIVGAGFTTNLCHSPFTYINPPRSHPRCDRFIVLVGYPKCELNPPWESAIASFPVIWVGLFFARLGWRGGGFRYVIPKNRYVGCKTRPYRIYCVG